MGADSIFSCADVSICYGSRVSCTIDFDSLSVTVSGVGWKSSRLCSVSLATAEVGLKGECD